MFQYANQIFNSITPEKWGIFLTIALAILLWDRAWGGLTAVTGRGRAVSMPLSDKVALIYVAFILLVTLFIREVGSGGKLAWTPLWSWREVLLHHDLRLLWQILLNVLLFVPLGMLLAWNRKWRVRAIVSIGFGLSMCIELCQLVFQLGLFEWDDILHNGIGCILGMLVIRVCHGVLQRMRNQ